MLVGTGTEGRRHTCWLVQGGREGGIRVGWHRDWGKETYVLVGTGTEGRRHTCVDWHRD